MGLDMRTLTLQTLQMTFQHQPLGPAFDVFDDYIIFYFLFIWVLPLFLMIMANSLTILFFVGSGVPIYFYSDLYYFLLSADLELCSFF